MSHLEDNIPHNSIPSLGSYIILILSSSMFPNTVFWAIHASFMVSTERVFILSILATFESLPTTRSIFLSS